jgi:hypothetical protein
VPHSSFLLPSKIKQQSSLAYIARANPEQVVVHAVTTWNKNAAETVEKSTNDDTMVNDNDHHLQLATESHVFNSKQSHTTKTHTRVTTLRLAPESQLFNSHQSHELQLFDSHQSHNSSTRTRVTLLRLTQGSHGVDLQQSHMPSTHSRVAPLELTPKQQFRMLGALLLQCRPQIQRFLFFRFSRQWYSQHWFHDKWYSRQ